jgi:hypothetical protein
LAVQLPYFFKANLCGIGLFLDTAFVLGKAYYEQQKSKGKPHNSIIRSLAFKWIRIVFRCWKTHTPYDESKYLEALKRRGSPLLKFAINS